jgi:ferric-dicitrate binding protein FerR (iron transport regulator)
VLRFCWRCSSFFFAGSGAIAQDGAGWHVSSGDVWVTHAGAQQAALTDRVTLKAGDTIRTGQTGRVLLTRGEESILISPNSVIGIPNGQINGMSTTIIQQAGSILLEVEKRNVKHFEVETPYLAAVVKGTNFRVTVNKNDANLDVLRGQVEVTDFKSGQIATVLPGQTASMSVQGQGGLSLSGSGTLSPIQQGAPRQSSVRMTQHYSN